MATYTKHTLSISERNVRGINETDGWHRALHTMMLQ